MLDWLSPSWDSHLHRRTIARLEGDLLSRGIVDGTHALVVILTLKVEGSKNTVFNIAASVGVVDASSDGVHCLGGNRAEAVLETGTSLIARAACLDRVDASIAGITQRLNAKLVVLLTTVQGEVLVPGNADRGKGKSEESVGHHLEKGLKRAKFAERVNWGSELERMEVV